MKKIRDSRFELLRIISMLLIVASHFSLQSVVSWNHINTPLEAVKLLYFDVLGQPGAIVFFIISGYFAFQSDDFAMQKEKAKNQVKKTWSKTWFYSVSILILVWLIFGRPSLKQIAMAVLPFSFTEYWFISCYIILIAISPWLNKLIKTMQYNEFRDLLIVLFILMFPALLNGGIINNLVLAFAGYLSGAFIKRFKDRIDNISNKTVVWTMVGVYVLMLISVACAKMIGISMYHSGHFTHFPLSYILALCVFILFSRMKPFKNKTINLLASGAFAVYLITVHQLMVPILWNNIIHIKIYQNMGILIPFITILISVIIYICCALLDIVLVRAYRSVKMMFRRSRSI